MSDEESYPPEVQRWFADLAATHGLSVHGVIERYREWGRSPVFGQQRFEVWLDGQMRIPAPDLGAPDLGAPESRAAERLSVEPAPGGGFRVKSASAQGRVVQELLRLLCDQPIGSVSETLLEVAGKVFALQQENAQLRMRLEEREMQLRARGVELP